MSTKMRAASVILFLGVMGSIFFLLDVLPDNEVVTTRNTSLGFLLAGVIAIFGNVFIIRFHATEPHHPKFVLMKNRITSIRIHALSGSLEVVLGVVAWVTQNTTLAIVVGCLAIFGHVPSSLYQAPGAFGSKGLTYPAYLGVIATHFYCAVRLVMEDGNIVWLERTWMALQAYAFMRIYGYFLYKVGAFSQGGYTVRMLLAGATVLPFILGPESPLLMMLILLAWTVLMKTIVKPTAAQWSDLFDEKERGSIIDSNLRALWTQKNMGSSLDSPSKENARAVFDYLDVDKSGSLKISEMENLLNEWGANTDVKESFMSNFGKSNGIDFGTFTSTIWLSGRAQEVLSKEASSHMQTPAEKSKFVFNQLDIDESGFIEMVEIEMLLLEWGLDSREAQRYISKFGGADKRLDYAEFHSKLSPIWEFASKPKSFL